MILKPVRFMLLGSMAALAMGGGAMAHNESHQIHFLPSLQSDVGEALNKAFEANTFSGNVTIRLGATRLYEGSFGYANEETKTQNTHSHVFRIGSITKTFASVSVLKLQELGKLKLDDPVSKHLENYPKENLQFQGREVLIKDLLHHEGGLPPMEKTDVFLENAWKRPIALDEIVAGISKAPLEFKPGSQFKYSNSGYMLLGKIVENACGCSFESFVQKQILLPVGMESTGIVLSDAQEKNLAKGYFIENGKRDTLFNYPELFKDTNITFVLSAGAMFSTVNDLEAWVRAVHKPGVLLNEDSIRSLFVPSRNKYGLGWVVEDIDGYEVHWHTGAISPLGYNSLLAYVPSLDLSVVLLANLDIDHADGDLGFEVLKTALKQISKK